MAYYDYYAAKMKKEKEKKTKNASERKLRPKIKKIVTVE
jgi:hypothetical protein